MATTTMVDAVGSIAMPLRRAVHIGGTAINIASAIRLTTALALSFLQRSLAVKDEVATQHQMDSALASVRPV
jgi:hypothetical protein